MSCFSRYLRSKRMRAHRNRLLASVPSILVLYLLSTSGVSGQEAPRLLGLVDDAKRVTLAGNIHPLARLESDRGAAPPDLPMDRMLLVLKRSPEQQAELQRLLDDQ